MLVPSDKETVGCAINAGVSREIPKTQLRAPGARGAPGTGARLAKDRGVQTASSFDAEKPVR